MEWNIKMSEYPLKTYPTIGCCGLDCGLCPRYYTVGSSRCTGCCGPDFFNKHPSCAFITCCVKKKNLEVCAQCEEFLCPKFDSSILNGGEYDSFLTYKKAYHNLQLIRKNGIEHFIGKQQKRIELLKVLLNDYDDGRSKSFYCVATTLLPIKDIEQALNETKQKMIEENIEGNDNKAKAMILKGRLNNFASKEGIKLQLRKKQKNSLQTAKHLSS